jgi:hypothetical protein
MKKQKIKAKNIVCNTSNREFIKSLFPYKTILQYRKDRKQIRIYSDKQSVKVEHGSMTVTGKWQVLIDFSSFPLNKTNEFYITKMFAEKTKTGNNLWMETHRYVTLKDELFK